ncbi:MAG: hypothetical protein PHS54_05725 [Clostridia bacterium]|nr:hypothetical protein [Clostridia bacterium]
MRPTYNGIIKRNYEKKLVIERETKGNFNTVNLPKNINSLKILPISNLFYGNDEAPPRLQLLDEHIKRINDMEDGAFAICGNLIYYPAGKTDEKASLARRYINDLSQILKRADKNKILLIYDGINETKFKDDRKLSYPIETTKVIAKNLGVSNKYYADTKVELDFVFNNELTNFTDQIMYGLFTSMRPISVTRNAILNKIKNNFLLNREKTFVIETSSSQSLSKGKIQRSMENPLLSRYKDVKWISVAGYTDMPQIVKKDNLYTVNQKVIELKIEQKNPALHQQNSKQSNVTKDDYWDRMALQLNIGVNYDSYFDAELYQELNEVLFKGEFIREDLTKKLNAKIEESIKNKQSPILQEIYKKREEKLKEEMGRKKEPASFSFE